MSDLTGFLGEALTLPVCLYNASGPRCTTRAELQALADSAAGAVLSKSCTVLAREGNAGHRYAYQPDLKMSINSTGLANLGYQFYGQPLELGLELGLGRATKPYLVSVAGLCRADNLMMIDYFENQMTDFKNGLAGLELNLSCPNIVGKPQLGYDFSGSAELLRTIFEKHDRLSGAMGLKLPPYFDNCHFEQMAQVITDFPIDYITCCNSLGHGFLIDFSTDQPAIEPNGGHGGLGGQLMKPVSLANVRKFRHLLPDRMSVVGCGGVFTGQDVYEHLLVGASAVQVGTCLMEEGPSCFKRLLDELATIMNYKGYQSVTEFRGSV